MSSGRLLGENAIYQPRRKTPSKCADAQRPESKTTHLREDTRRIFVLTEYHNWIE
jgi:hypothetical protein